MILVKRITEFSSPCTAWKIPILATSRFSSVLRRFQRIRPIRQPFRQSVHPELNRTAFTLSIVHIKEYFSQVRKICGFIKETGICSHAQGNIRLPGRHNSRLTNRKAASILFFMPSTGHRHLRPPIQLSLKLKRPVCISNLRESAPLTAI